MAPRTSPTAPPCWSTSSAWTRSRTSPWSVPRGRSVRRRSSVTPTGSRVGHIVCRHRQPPRARGQRHRGRRQCARPIAADPVRKRAALRRGRHPDRRLPQPGQLGRGARRLAGPCRRHQHRRRRRRPRARRTDQRDDPAWASRPSSRTATSAVPTSAPSRPRCRHPTTCGSLGRRTALVASPRSYPGSRAELAGLMRGDVVVAADGRPLSDAQSLQRVLLDEVVGRTLEVTVPAGVRPGRRLRGATAPAGVTRDVGPTLEAWSPPTGAHGCGCPTADASTCGRAATRTAPARLLPRHTGRAAAGRARRRCGLPRGGAAARLLAARLRRFHGRPHDSRPVGRDAGSVADALGLERFAVLGVSGRRAVCGRERLRLPDRVRVGVVAGVGPLLELDPAADDPAVRAALAGDLDTAMALRTAR